MTEPVPVDLARGVLTFSFFEGEEEEDGANRLLRVTDEAISLFDARMPPETQIGYDGDFIWMTWGENNEHEVVLSIDDTQLAADGIEFDETTPEETVLRYLALEGMPSDRRTVLNALRGAMEELTERRTKGLRREAAKKLTTIGHVTRFPPELNAEVLKFLAPANVPSPKQSERKAAAYRAMVKSGPAIEAIHQRRRAAEESPDQDREILAAMKTGGRRKTTTRKTRRRATRRRR